MTHDSSAQPSSHQQEEYRALRQTIAQRGTAKIWILVAGFLGWAGLTMATAIWASLPVATFLPLLVLAVTFEAIFSMHVGVERIGRYIQVFHEVEATGWEHTAMAFGRPLKGTGTDPLFVAHFVIATVLNFIPALLVEPPPVHLELTVVGVAHLLFIGRMFLARRSAGRQRAADLKRFEEMKVTGRAQL
jgi:hypothetical protein